MVNPGSFTCTYKPQESLECFHPTFDLSSALHHDEAPPKRSLGALTSVGRKLGKACQVAKEMWRLKLAILGVSETRWTGAGKVHLTTGETVLPSDQAGDDALHEKGDALILSKAAGKRLKE